MKKQFFLFGAVAILGFAACNDTASDSTTTTDSTATSTTITEKRGMQIANFDTRTFMDLKTNKPVKLRWNAEKYYYEDESGSQPYYYYDPSAKDTFDYWGRRVNSYLTYSDGDYMLDESRMPAMEMSSDMNKMMDTGSSNMSNSNMSTSGDIKIKSTDDKYKEKTDTSKLKVTNDKIKIKDK